MIYFMPCYFKKQVLEAQTVKEAEGRDDIFVKLTEKYRNDISDFSLEEIKNVLDQKDGLIRLYKAETDREALNKARRRFQKCSHIKTEKKERRFFI